MCVCVCVCVCMWGGGGCGVYAQDSLVKQWMVKRRDLKMKNSLRIFKDIGLNLVSRLNGLNKR